MELQLKQRLKKMGGELLDRVGMLFVLFTLSSHWLFRVFSFLLIGRCDYLGFSLTTLNRKAL